MDYLEYENEEEKALDFEGEQLEDLEEPNNDGIDKNLENMQKNSDEIIKQQIFEGVEEKDINENLMNQALKFCKLYELDKNDKGLDIMKSMFSEILEFSNYNFNARLKNFLSFIEYTKGVELDTITRALQIKVSDLEKDNNKDIIFFWKQFITEDYLKKQSILINSEDMKDCIKLLLEHNFNLNQIYSIFFLFKDVLINKKNPQFEIINSLITTLILYPNYFELSKEEKEKGGNKKEEELKDFINKYIISEEYVQKNGDKEVEYIFDKTKNVALDFYLKISGDKNSDKSHELEVQEIFQFLKMNNPDITDPKIMKIEEQLTIINSVIKDPRYQIYEEKDFQRWAKMEFPKLKFDTYNADRSTGIILGMISLAIKKSKEINKEKGYFLRNTQLIAILLFISKDPKKGLIEEISTGEGKSSIICSLAIYFALRKHKVDIISSSYTLAQRDSDGFKSLFNFFNLTTSYPFDSKPGPYKADILYGTFFEFEGDYLRDVTSERTIRNKRPYDVIIIDEVDNLLIDNILWSTRLTNSSRGFKFLIPMYLTIYITFELFDYFFMLFFKIGLENVENEETKNKFALLINNPRKRKEEIIKIIKGDFKDLFDFKDIKPKENINIEDKTEQNKEKLEKIGKENKKYVDFFYNLRKYVEFPDFLSSFVTSECYLWLDSAFNAKNIMEIDRDYVEVINKKGHRDISPVDRKNTGETQLSTVYSEGLHQMLEIKHKFRVKEESLVHTFLSHISFFQKYKNKDNFLFFGLTGTIGNKETQKIYKSKYFDSKLLFIPQYKKKRFIELPPLLVNIKDHFNAICKDIVYNFYKGRKILVICNSIKEAKILEEELKNKFDLNTLGLPNDIIQKEDFRESIILYTRSDTEKTNIEKRQKRIILSTNLGGRGTDIKTSGLEEEGGGLHVILTYMPNNYRVLKQAFGRTSREGKKGTGQIILRNTGNFSYTEIKNEMLENEQKEINYIQKRLKILLFKDELFEDFIYTIRNVDFNGYLIEDINEKWAQFLRANLNADGDDLKMEEVNKKYINFKTQIKKLLKEGKEHEKFENPFYKMQEGLRLHDKYDNELLNFFNFKTEQTKFYFTQPYIKVVIKVINTDKYDDKFFDYVISGLKESIKRIELLIQENINPVLFSFEQWEGVLINLESALEIYMDFKNKNDLDKPFADKSFLDSDLYKQYTNIKAVCNKIKDRFEENKKFFEDFKNEYKKDNNLKIYVTEEDLVEGLSLTEEELKEEEFFSDATFKYVYKFSKKKKMNFATGFFALALLGLLTYLGGLLSGVITGFAFLISASAYAALKISSHYSNGRDISTNSIFGNLFYLIVKATKKNTNRHQNFALELNGPDSKLLKSNKTLLFEKIMEDVENKFVAIKKSEKIVNFLIFVDYFYGEDFWAEKIKNIFIEKFNLIYKTNFIEDKFFKNPITKDSFNEHLNRYNSLLNTYLEECIKEIIKLGNPKQFNKKDGINCLEHLIRDLNSEKISDKIADEIVQKMLENRLILEDGRVSQRLFEDCFINKEGKILEQNIQFNVINKIKDKKAVKRIKDLKEFIINGFEIPLVNSSFIDLANFYQIKGYKVQEQLGKDFSLFIIINFKRMIIRLLNIEQEKFENFYKYCMNLAKNLIKNLLQEKIFSKYNKSSFENVISAELSEEEKKEFDKLVSSAKDKAMNLIKN